MLTNEQQIWQNIHNDFSIPQANKFTNICDNNKHLSWKSGSRTFDKMYYINKKYLSELSQPDLNIINTNINKDVLIKLGYELEK